MLSNRLILLPSSPFAFNLSWHQGLFQWVDSSHQVAKVLELQHQFFQWVFGVDFLLLADKQGQLATRRLSECLSSQAWDFQGWDLNGSLSVFHSAVFSPSQHWLSLMISSKQRRRCFEGQACWSLAEAGGDGHSLEVCFILRQSQMCAPNSQPACMITQTQARERKKAYLFRSCWWIASDGNVSNLCSYWFPDLDSVWEFPRFDKAWWLVTLPEWLWSGRGSLLKYDLHVVRFLIFSHLFVAVIWVRWASRPFFFGTNLLCPAELHPCQGLSPCPVSSKPSGHQGKPASTWSSKG